MKQFNIVRYVKRFKWLVFALATIGALCVFLNAMRKQTYTASMVIRFMNGNVPEDMREIYSPNIIDAALVELDIDSDIDRVRSRFRVEEVVPETDQIMIDALLAKGTQPDYETDTFRVSYTDSGRENAQDILDAVMKNYYEAYTTRFVQEQIPDNGVIDLLTSGNDYLESAEVLEDSILEMLNFLNRKEESQQGLRSIHTGRSYEDLYEAFHYLYRHDLPLLYVEIVSTANAKDIEVIRTTLRREIADLYRHLGHLQQQLDLLDVLKENFIEQTTEIDEYHRDVANDRETGENVMDGVQEVSGNRRKPTTYDELMEQYVDLRTEYEETKIDIAHKEFLLDAFNSNTRVDMDVELPDDPASLYRKQETEEAVESEAGIAGEESGTAVTEVNPAGTAAKTAQEPAETAQIEILAAEELEKKTVQRDIPKRAVTPEQIESHIESMVTAFNEYYNVAKETCRELNGVLSAQYLSTVSSITVTASIQLTRYVIMALFLFLFLGVVLSVLLGRGIELMEGMLYVDRALDLPNRARCDLFIEEHSEKLLPENYCCISWNLELNRISERFGRHTGDEVLKDFAQILRSFREVYGFIAHNGGGQFFAFFENCSRSRLEAILNT
nr:diguanylate cyclase [Lachnospiraceae bacterium]